MTTTYTCKTCNAPAKVEDGQVNRTCTCNDTVIANLHATAYGLGRMK
jgi:hypothetical protein